MTEVLFSDEKRIIITACQNSTIDNVDFNLLKALNMNESNWIQGFKLTYEKIVVFFIKDTVNNLAKTKANININRDIEKYIDYFTGRKISLISETTRKEIKSIILKNLKEGNRMRSIEYDLRNLYDRFSKSRAKTIALTEVAGISNYAMLQGAISQDKNGDTKKKWIPILDSKTRDSHSFMINHESIELDKPFSVGGTKLMFPGDPTAPAKEVIRCRCTLKFIKE